MTFFVIYSVAKKTAHIRYLQGLVEQRPRDRKIFVFLKELVDRRKKLLKYLRCWDYKRFEWLLEKLDLEYKPEPEQYIQATRRISLKRLTNIHCDEVREERLLAYRKKLESQQMAFLEEKLKNFEFIRNEQIECQVEVTVSKSQIDAVKSQCEELKKKREEALENVETTEKWKMY